MTGPGSESATLPDVAAEGRVKVQVGLGIRGEDLPQLVATARQVRHVALVEILGQTRKAVEDARTLFTTAWDILDKQAAPGGTKEAAKLWAALLLAVRGQEAAGAAFWDSRSFVDPFGGAGGR